MVSVFLVAAMVTIVPSLGFLWSLLGRYEGYFEDARVFFALVVGFFAGLVVAFLENALFLFDDPAFIASAGAATAFVLFVTGYAFVESAAKTVVLGTAKFRKRKDTPYYGAALGLGFGAMVALQAVARGLSQVGLVDRSVDAQWLLALTLIVLSACGTVLAAACSGVFVGRGSADGRLWRGMVHGALAVMPTLAALWFFRPAPAIIPAVASFAYAVALTAYVQRKVLDKVVPPEIRDLVSKERRRAEREKLRQPPPT